MEKHLKNGIVISILIGCVFGLLATQGSTFGWVTYLVGSLVPGVIVSLWGEISRIVTEFFGGADNLRDGITSRWRTVSVIISLGLAGLVSWFGTQGTGIEFIIFFALMTLAYTLVLHGVSESINILRSNNHKIKTAKWGHWYKRFAITYLVSLFGGLGYAVAFPGVGVHIIGDPNGAFHWIASRSLAGSILAKIAWSMIPISILYFVASILWSISFFLFQRGPGLLSELFNIIRGFLSRLLSAMMRGGRALLDALIELIRARNNGDEGDEEGLPHHIRKFMKVAKPIVFICSVPVALLCGGVMWGHGSLSRFVVPILALGICLAFIVVEIWNMNVLVNPNYPWKTKVGVWLLAFAICTGTGYLTFSMVYDYTSASDRLEWAKGQAIKAEGKYMAASVARATSYAADADTEKERRAIEGGVAKMREMHRKTKEATTFEGLNKSVSAFKAAGRSVILTVKKSKRNLLDQIPTASMPSAIDLGNQALAHTRIGAKLGFVDPLQGKVKVSEGAIRAAAFVTLLADYLVLILGLMGLFLSFRHPYRGLVIGTSSEEGTVLVSWDGQNLMEGNRLNVKNWRGRTIATLEVRSSTHDVGRICEVVSGDALRIRHNQPVEAMAH